MTTEALLKDIREFISTATKDDVTDTEISALRFNSGADIIEAIDTVVGKASERRDLMIIEDVFDPFTDPDTRHMLGLAGIATHNRR